VIGVDGDVDLLPYFARTKEEVQQSLGFRRFYYEKLQWLVFPLALAFVGFNMQLSGWRALVGSLQQSTSSKRREWIDLVFMVSHYVVWLAIPMAFFQPLHVVEFYCLRIALMGYALFAVLAPGHYPVEAACLGHAGKNCDYVLLQTAATVNFRTGVVGRLICSGLEYQIEHHLFPNISHVHYPKLAPIVKDFCRAYGLPYRCYPWSVVAWKSLQMLQSPPPVQTDLNGFRPEPVKSTCES
jgi:fatty acid desaturase